jgi:hypothetical protein
MLNRIELVATDDPKIGHLVATDGYRLVVQPVEIEARDVPQGIPAEAIKIARRRESERLAEAREAAVGWDESCGLPIVTTPQPLEINADAVGVGITGMIFNKAEGLYPNYKNVLAKIKPAKFRIALNADLLAGIQHALGAGCVLLEISGETEGIKVLPGSTYPRPHGIKAGGFGILMPVRDESAGEIAP